LNVSIILILIYDKLLVRVYCDHTKMFDVFQDVEVEEEPKDERSVEDLLSFINGADGGMSCLSP